MTIDHPITHLTELELHRADLPNHGLHCDRTTGTYTFILHLREGNAAKQTYHIPLQTQNSDTAVLKRDRLIKAIRLQCQVMRTRHRNQLNQ